MPFGFIPDSAFGLAGIPTRSADNRIMVVAYSIRGDSFEAEKPRVWSKAKVFLAATDIMQGFDLTPDGKRFAVLRPVEHQASQDTRHNVTPVLNFLEEVRRGSKASRN